MGKRQQLYKHICCKLTSARRPLLLDGLERKKQALQIVSFWGTSMDFLDDRTFSSFQRKTVLTWTSEKQDSWRYISV
uniref:Uncharacterized protein n=2 Tax=Picea TaxID=3328 RepID=A0A101LX10_PICGL|nr:hypothetical protein ABT39_MTgene6345 [Picea glauca]QHR91415.1 hypothetical protein Q903MT_gene5449 [Picea sitchensis]